MKLAPLLGASLLIGFSVLRASGSGCGGSSSPSGSGDDSGSEASGGSSGATEGGGGDGNGGSGGSSGGGAVTCANASTSYVMNGGTCGSYRWAVKTGTDDDVTKVNMIPEVTTVATLVAIPTPAVSSCSRSAAEQKLYELKNIIVEFEREEADDDYHIVAHDGASTMVTEVPFPGCLGHDSCQNVTPWACAISRARATVDAQVPQGTMTRDLGTATVIGAGFFDVYELNGTTHPAGMAPNGIELHPILAICFGQDCDPTAGY